MNIVRPHSMITQAFAVQVTALRIRFHSGAHRSHYAGHVGTSNTLLVGAGVLVRPNGGSHRRGAM
jgi:hypothetical protein